MGNMLTSNPPELAKETDEPFEEIQADFAFPKVELHCHLDGSFRIATVIDLAKQRGIKLVSYDVKELSKYGCVTIEPDASLDKFLSHFQYFSPAFVGSAMAIRRMTIEAIEDSLKRDIVYIEFRFCPHLLATADNAPLNLKAHHDLENQENLEPNENHTEPPITPWEVLQVVIKAAEETTKRLPQIKVRFIMSAIVAFPEWSRELAEMCIAHRDWVVGLDLAGSTDGIPPEKWNMHVAAFDYAHENNVNITIHAGEAEGPQSCVKAVDQLHASRIGHGYHIKDDPEVYARFLSMQTHLECCPRSSYCTGAVSPKEKHPLVSFQRDNMNCSISTDDPGIMITTLLTDYHIAVDDMGLTVDDLKQMNLKAAKSSFLPEAERKELVRQLEEAYGL